MGFPELTSDALRQAFEWHRQGRLDEALAAYEAQLRRKPDSHQANYLLGLFWLERNESSRAEFYLNNAIQLKPDEPHYLGAVADLFQARGQSREAINYYKAALNCNGSDETAEIRLNYGATLMDLGHGLEALAEFQKVAHWRPGWAAAWNNMGNALMHQGRYEQAVEAFDTVLALSGEIYETHANLAKLRNEIGQNQQALLHAKKAIAIQPGPAAAWFQLGLAELELGNLDEAETALQQCLQRAPKASGAFALLGQIAEQRGNLTKAKTDWLNCLALQPRHAAVLGRMATRLGLAMPAEWQLQMERMFQEQGLKAVDCESLGYGLAHLSDLRGEFEKATVLLDRACQAREAELARRGMSYDPAQFENMVLKWNQRFQEIRLDPAERRQLADVDGPRMVFIVGLPRSGTSLVEQVLATHSAISGAGELTWIPDLAALSIKADHVAVADLLAMKMAYLHQLHQKGFETPVVIDKLPDNIYYVGLIRQVFPDALIIRCRRELRDVALSCRMTRFMSVRWNSRWENLVARISFYQRFVSQQLAGLENEILEIPYEEMVGNLNETIAPVFDRLQLEPPADCQSFHQNRRVVRTASAGQVRQPLYNSSVGRWQNYEFAYGERFEKIRKLERTD